MAADYVPKHLSLMVTGLTMRDVTSISSSLPAKNATNNSIEASSSVNTAVIQIKLKYELDFSILAVSYHIILIINIFLI